MIPLVAYSQSQDWHTISENGQRNLKNERLSALF